MNVELTVEDTATPLLRAISESFGPAGASQANEAGGRGAVVAAGRFHREFDARGGWRGPNSYGSGRSDFGAEIARSWFFRESDAGGATIANHAEHYAFKVTGGTITPKRVNWLTIPLIEEARGRRAKDYEIDFNTKLFRPRGKDVLMEKTGKGEKGVRGVYALLKSVTQRPWPDAVPPLPMLADAFVGGVEEWLDSQLDDA